HPFTDQVSLEFSWPEAASLDLTIYDATGRRMLQRRIHTATGANNLSLETQNWPSGTYFIFAESPHFRAREVAIKQR
ncbi:MAG: T9SS type A sorting domain-containing protein, partial [Lewinella sp.]|nr:T9SS type A sorting domain-containing protein [Lewinella sp.]